MNTALYCRVSTADQTTANQKLELEQVADRMGWTIAQTFTDVISGARAKRPGLDALMLAVTRKDVDMVRYGMYPDWVAPYRIWYPCLRNSMQKASTCTFISRA